MKHFLRLGWTILAAGCATLAVRGNEVLAQPIAVFSDTPAYLVHSSQSYLGVDIHDVDTDRATALKLKEVRGAEIVTVDHDAPANKAGLKIHDVVLEMNGQRVEGADQLRRMLRETPPGHTVNFVISRDGQQQNISVQLADRAKVEANAWSQHFSVPDPSNAPVMDGFIAPQPSRFGNGFFGVFTTNGLYVGADVDVISTQLASYFGVSDGTGLLVKSVDENSPAATAGLKAGDVITKVNNDAMASRADWMKTLHNNRGKQIQITVMRNKKEQMLSMQAGEPKKKGELEMPYFSPDAFDRQELRDQMRQQLRAQLDCSLAEVIPDMVTREIQGVMNSAEAAAFSQQAGILAKSIDAKKLSGEIQKSLDSMDVQKMQQQMEELKDTLGPLEIHQTN